MERKTVTATVDVELGRNGILKSVEVYDDSPTSLLKALSLEHTLSQDKCSQTQAVPPKYKGPGGPRRLRDG